MVAPELEAGPYRSCPIHINIHGWTDNEGPSKALRELVNRLEVSGRWGVEGRVPYLFLHHLMRHAAPKLEDAEPVLEAIRERKDEEEVSLLKRSAEILSKSYLKIPSMLVEGMTEQELERKISAEIFLKGAEGIEDMLVQSGEKSADPHSLPSRRKIRRGESIVIDISSTHSGYFADITRSFIIGRNVEFEATYAKVLEAEEKAIRQSRGGVTVGSVDAAARGSLERAGLGRYFIHRTGHGLGLEVHEAPYIVDRGKEVLKSNMFFTVEPGVYKPGRYGVRIEDDVMSTERGREVVTTIPKEYGWWN
jgi:Xaa-Pro dipeptidase